MRIAVANWSRREAGGAERYLSRVIPALTAAGHEVALLYELDEPQDRGSIPLGEGAPAWSVAELGRKGAVAALREWRPDLVYTHIVRDPALEEALLEAAPGVFFAHGYFGTCISGAKSFKRPAAMPCGRRFGWQCMLHYYPRRCGGMSPVTMLRGYRSQARRRDLLPEYAAIVTNSAHMGAEFTRYVSDPSRVHVVPLPVTEERPAPGLAVLEVSPRAARGEPWNLLFLGRMTSLKGGTVLLDALPLAAEALGKPLRVTFAGDGPDQELWKARGAALSAVGPGVSTEFVGWMDDAGLESLWGETDLLVVPSLWPEPFGLVGPEAGLRGVPAVAFAVGGIPDWLHDGVSGHLAPATPPTAEGLAGAIVRSLRDPGEHALLRRGARETAGRFCQEEHLSALLRVFENVAGGTRPLATGA